MADDVTLPPATTPAVPATTPETPPAAGQVRPGDILAVSPDDGQVHSLKADDANKAVAEGWKPASPEQRQAYVDKLAGSGHAVRTALEQGANTALFGLPAQVLKGTQLGEQMRQNKVANPGSAAIGEVGGLFVPGSAEGEAMNLFGKAGQGLAERVMGKLLPEAATSVGGKVAQYAAKELAPVFVRGAAESLPYTTGNIITEQALGDPDLAGEHLWQHAAEKYEDGMLNWGAFSAGTHGLLDVVKPAVQAGKAAVTKLGDAFQSLYTKGAEVAGVEDAASRFKTVADTGLPPELQPGTEPQMPAGPAPDADALNRQFVQGLTETRNSVRQVSKELTQELRPGDRELALKSVPIEQAQKAAAETMAAGTSLVQKMEESPAIFSKGYVERLKNHLTEFSKGLTEEATSADIYNGLDDLKGQLEGVTKLDKGAMASAADQPVMRELDAFRSGIRDGLEDANTWGEQGAMQAKTNRLLKRQIDADDELKKAMFEGHRTGKGVGKSFEGSPQKVAQWLNAGDEATQDIKHRIFQEYVDASHELIDHADEVAERTGMHNGDWGRDGARQLLDQTNQVAEQARGFKAQAATRGDAQAAYDAAMKKRTDDIANFGKSKADKSGHLLEGAALITGHVPLAGAVLAAKGVKSAVQGLTHFDETALRFGKLREIGNKVSKVIDSNINGIVAKAQNVGATAARVGAVALTSKEEVDRYQARLDSLAKLSDPETLVQNTVNAAGQLHVGAPNVAAGLSKTQARAFSFLKSQVRQPSLKGMLAPKWKPSAAEAQHFNKIFDAVAKPVHTTLNGIKTGMLTPDQVNAVNAVHPATMQVVKTRLMDKLASVKDPLTHFSYPQLQAMGMVLGVDMDGTMNPDFIAARQANHAGGGQGSAPAPAPAPHGSPARAANIGFASRLQTGPQNVAARRNR